jgi:hypothetical protein
MTHHCKRHRPAARHRRLTAGFHARRLATIAAFAAAAIGLLYAVPVPAGAQQSDTASTAATVRRVDYGSGPLSNWQTLTHGTVGDILDTQYDGDAQADVLIVGDSITTRTYSDLIARIQAAGHTAAVNYWSGRPTAPAVDWVLSLSTKPKRIVMASGSNDVMDPSVMTAQIRRLKAGLPETTELLWVDTYVARPAYGAADLRNTAAVNKQILAEMGPDAVISWFDMFWTQPWRALTTGYLQDGVHPWVGAVEGEHYDGVAFRNAVLLPKIVAGLS